MFDLEWKELCWRGVIDKKGVQREISKGAPKPAKHRSTGSESRRGKN